MMTLLRVTLSLTLAFGLLGQTANPKQPKPPKGKMEAEMINAVFQAQDPDQRIAAVEGLLGKFHDTEYKGLALYLATVAAEQKNDFEKMVLYGERTLEADPKFYAVMLMMARGYAQKTREHDFDKDEKLTKSDKWAMEGIALAKDAPKMNPAIADPDWEAAKKDFMSQGHEALAMSAMVRKKYDVAATEFNNALTNMTKPDPATQARLGSVYNLQNKWDDALAVLDKANANPEAQPAVKQYIASERVKALMGKKKAEAAAAPKPQ
jgi:tetratricopeptide (TPR) repeat protein